MHFEPGHDGVCVLRAIVLDDGTARGNHAVPRLWLDDDDGARHAVHAHLLAAQIEGGQLLCGELDVLVRVRLLALVLQEAVEGVDAELDGAQEGHGVVAVRRVIDPAFAGVDHDGHRVARVAKELFEFRAKDESGQHSLLWRSVHQLEIIKDVLLCGRGLRPSRGGRLRLLRQHLVGRAGGGGREGRRSGGSDARDHGRR